MSSQYNKIKLHLVPCLIIFFIAFANYFQNFSRFENLEYVDGISPSIFQQWWLWSDSAWAEFASSLSLIENGEIRWMYLYLLDTEAGGMTQRAHALIPATLIISAFIKLFGIYPGLLFVRCFFLVANSFVPVLIYATSYKIFKLKPAAFLAGLLLALEPFIATETSNLSRHPPSILFFGLVLFMIVAFLLTPREKIRLPLTLMTGIFAGLACISDGDGLGVLLAFVLSVIILQMDWSSWKFQWDKKIICYTGIVVLIAGTIYMASLVRVYNAIGIFAPNWIMAQHLAASNNDTVLEWAKNGKSLFRQALVTSLGPELTAKYMPIIDKKFKSFIFPEKEKYLANMEYFKNWILDKPLGFTFIVLNRFFQNTVTYKNFIAGFIAFGALLSLFFLKPVISRAFPLLLIWSLSSLLYCLIYLTWWHQMHQVMVLSILAGFGIHQSLQKVEGALLPILKGIVTKVPWAGFLGKVARPGFLFFVSLFVFFAAKDSLSYTLRTIFASPDKYKNDYLAVKEKMPEDTLFITQHHPFLVNKIIERDVLITKFTNRFDPFAPKQLENGWLVTKPKGEIYQYRESAQYLTKTVDFVTQALKSGIPVVSDFNPNIDRQLFPVRKIFSGERIKFFKFLSDDESGLQKFITVNNDWRDKHISLLDHPYIREINGNVLTDNPNYIFQIVDDLDASVVMEFPLDKNRTVSDLSLIVSLSSTTDSIKCVQISIDQKTWVDVNFRSPSDYPSHPEIELPILLFKEKVFLRIYEDKASNLSVKTLSLWTTYKPSQ